MGGDGVTASLRPIEPAPFRDAVPPGLHDPGPAPILQWLKIADLVVDDTYQRAIIGKGAQNIRRIAGEFDWSKFSPVVVAPVEGGRFAIVDGQHRTTAAAARGFDEVPCEIVQADRRQQASAFASINGALTQVSPLQRFWAQLAAGEPAAVAADEVARAAGVTLLRHSVSPHKLRHGETQSIGFFVRIVARYPKAAAILGLRCLVETGDHPGLLTALWMASMIDLVAARPDWIGQPDALLAALRGFDFLAVAAKVSATGRRSRVAPDEVLQAYIVRWVEQRGLQASAPPPAVASPASEGAAKRMATGLENRGDRKAERIVGGSTPPPSAKTLPPAPSGALTRAVFGDPDPDFHRRRAEAEARGAREERLAASAATRRAKT